MVADHTQLEHLLMLVRVEDIMSARSSFFHVKIAATNSWTCTDISCLLGHTVGLPEQNVDRIRYRTFSSNARFWQARHLRHFKF